MKAMLLDILRLSAILHSYMLSPYMFSMRKDFPISDPSLGPVHPPHRYRLLWLLKIYPLGLHFPHVRKKYSQQNAYDVIVSSAFIVRDLTTKVNSTT